MGQLLFFYQTFQERARAGARYAAVNTYDPETIKNLVVYNSASGSGSALFGLRTSMVNVNHYDAGAVSERLEIGITSSPVRFFSPLLAGRNLSPVFRAVIPVESLGATD